MKTSITVKIARSASLSHSCLPVCLSVCLFARGRRPLTYALALMTKSEMSVCQINSAGGEIYADRDADTV